MPFFKNILWKNKVSIFDISGYNLYTTLKVGMNGFNFTFIIQLTKRKIKFDY